jgi:hypothetical protein
MPTRDDAPLADVEAFVERHNQQRPNAAAAEPTERELAAWVKGVVDGHVRASHEVALRVYQIADLPPRPLPSITDERLADLEDFIERNGRFPRADGIVASLTDERSLALWAGAVRRGARKVADETAAAVERLAQLHPPPPKRPRRRPW